MFCISLGGFMIRLRDEILACMMGLRGMHESMKIQWAGSVRLNVTVYHRYDTRS